MEVLFVTSLLGLFMYMVVRALMMGYRAHIVTIEKTARYRDATVALAKMVREISTANEIETPPLSALPATANRLTLWRNNATSYTTGLGSGVHVDYTYDPASKELRAEDLNRPPLNYRVVVRDVEGFTVVVESIKHIDIAIAVKGNNVPLNVTAQAFTLGP